ncbi:hypothetical protein LCGC14_1408320 [marine sediment metagenome]|uniref:Terminase small subunit n=1 Tax=marine sediment metagenome TaxID=412755 RepID=A0A0F9JVA8_9ZZZZ
MSSENFTPEGIKEKKAARRRPHRGLTPQLERFCQEYVVDLNGKQAAIRAGYSEQSAASQAADILRRPRVAARVEMLQAQVTGRIQLDAEHVIHQLMQDHKDAKTAGNHSAAVRATELLGKRLGLWIDRIRTDADNKSDDDLADEVVDAALGLAKGDKRLKARIMVGLGILDVDSGKGETPKPLI